MNSSYDENLAENPFFIELKKGFSNLYEHCISQSWILCVPRVESLTTRVFTVEDFCSHILVPSDELPETHYNTLTEKQVIVLNKIITLEVTKGLPMQSHILFEETFYTADYMKYKVWCIEKPLGPCTSKGIALNTVDSITSITDCIDLLWTQAAGRQVLDQVEYSVQLFLRKHTSLPIAVAPLRDLVSELYTQCLQIALQNRRIREKSNTSKQMLDNIKLAIESYMQYLIYNAIFKSLCTSCAYEDSHLNKRIRNLADLQLRDLDIRKDLYHNVPKAKQILSKLNTYNTVLEKIYCLKEALNAINKVDKANNIIFLTADDMLPVFMFLVLKSNIPNWYSQLTYLKEFRFSEIVKGSADECAFLITTLEAVLQHIQSGAFEGPPNPESYYYESDLTEDNLNDIARRKSLTDSISTDTNSGEETLDDIFELIKASHNLQVKVILERNQKTIASIQQNESAIVKLVVNDCGLFSDDDESDGDSGLKLCHPLCNCRKCYKKISKNLLKTSPTVASRDSHGLTPLHVACIHGKAIITETLLEMGAEIEATDLNECTPLHHAASRGHQDALLLLLHAGANINSTNIDKNTPLHMSVNNAHLNCVKALIYFAEHSRKYLNINCTNENGNTPLHFASKWGYEGITKILIENGAEPSIQNRDNKTAFDYAHNIRIMNLLKTSSPNLIEYIHITSPSVQPKPLKTSEYKESQNNMFNTSVTKTVENMKRIERILRAITYGDIKLACFYMNINYNAYTDLNQNGVAISSSCHPLCECQTCKKKCGPYPSDYDVNSTDTNGTAPLHLAAMYGFEDLCYILISNKANVNISNKKGESPMHLAAAYNKAGTLRILMENAANVNAMDLAGNTALHEAARSGSIGAVKVLLTHNPDTSILNGADKSALDIAKEKVHLTIIDLIDKYNKKCNERQE